MVIGSKTSCGAKVATTIAVLVAVLAARPVLADVNWSWAFGSESGTFVTTGTFAETAAPAVFTFKSFSVSASVLPGNVGVPYNEGSQPIQTMSWDGTQPTQFTRLNGVLTNGSNFYTPDQSYFYGFQAGPVVGELVNEGIGMTVVSAALTILPLGDVVTTSPAPLLSTGGLLVVGLALLGVALMRLRRSTATAALRA